MRHLLAYCSTRSQFGISPLAVAVRTATVGKLLSGIMAEAEDERILTKIGGNQEQNVRTKEVWWGCTVQWNLSSSGTSG